MEVQEKAKSGDTIDYIGTSTHMHAHSMCVRICESIHTFTYISTRVITCRQDLIRENNYRINYSVSAVSVLTTAINVIVIF